VGQKGGAEGEGKGCIMAVRGMDAPVRRNSVHNFTQWTLHRNVQIYLVIYLVWPHQYELVQPVG